MGMDANTIALLALGVSVLALIISVPVAYTQVSQYFEDRRGVFLSYSMKTEQGTWNEVHLTNLSSKPIVVSDWEMTWKKRRFFRRNVEKRADIRLGPDPWPLTLEPHKRVNITLSDVYDFNWNPKKNMGSLYIDLHVTGRNKPLRKFIFKPYYPAKK